MPSNALPPDSLSLLLADVTLLNKALRVGDRLYIEQVLSRFNHVRKIVQIPPLSQLLRRLLPFDDPQKANLLAYLETPPPLKESSTDTTNVSCKSSSAVSLYLHIVVASILHREKRTAEAAQCSLLLLDRCRGSKKRLLEPLLCKAYKIFYLYSLDTLGRECVERELTFHYSKSCFEHLSEAQLTLLNLTTHMYLESSLYDRATKLIKNSDAAEKMGSCKSQKQRIRFLYYQGLIAAFHFEYSEALQSLNSAMRLMNETVFTGFYVRLVKLLCVVQMLMGDSPEKRHIEEVRKIPSIAPYLSLIKSVQIGDLQEYENVMEKFKRVFESDHLHGLCLRLSQSVITIGLRKLSISYSTILLSDVCKRLGLSSPREAQYLTARAISDGVIEGQIVQGDAGVLYLKTQSTSNFYGSRKPRLAMEQRTAFCSTVWADTLKSMKYDFNKEVKHASNEEYEDIDLILDDDYFSDEE